MAIALRVASCNFVTGCLTKDVYPLAISDVAEDTFRIRLPISAMSTNTRLDENWSNSSLRFVLARCGFALRPGVERKLGRDEPQAV